MRLHRWMFAATLLCCAVAMAQTAPVQETKDTEAIKQVLHDQEAAWNRGDVETFMRGYKDSPETTFIGKTINRGYLPILERYKKAYATHDAMGTLDFSEVTVRMLGNNYAVVTGRYHLARTTAGGGDASGIFSLIFEREGDAWKIILDHTS